jgi:hypothetical protein
MKKITVITIVFISLLIFVSVSKTTQSKENADESVYLPIIQKPVSPYWNKTYPEQSYKDFAVTKDGGHLVLASDTSYGFTLAKLDANGEPVWEKTGSTYMMQPQTLTELDDGTIIIAGEAAVPSATNDKLWVAKFSNAGNLMWQKGYFHDNHGGNAFALTPTSNGGVAVAGHKDNDSDTDFWVLNLDKNGAIIWQKTFGGNKTDLATVIKTTPDKGFVIAGYTYSFSPLSYTWVIKLNSAGSLVWQKMLQGEYSWDLINDAAVAPDGSSYFIGKKNDASGSGTNKWWVFKLDSAGTLVWSKTYGITGSTGSSGNHIAILDNNNIFISGSSYKDHSNWLIMNLDSDGNARWHKVFEHSVYLQHVDSQFMTVTGSVDGDLLLAKSNLSADEIGCPSAAQPTISVVNLTKRIQTTDASLSSPTISIENTGYSVTNSTFPDSQELVCGS